MTQSSPHPLPLAEQPAPSHVRPLLLLVIATCLATAVQMKFPYINGPWYYTWNWQLLPPQTYLPRLLIAAAPVFAGLLVYQRTRRRDWSLFLICLGFAAVTLVVSHLQTNLGGWERTIRIVRSPGATSYFTAAYLFLHPGSSETFRSFLAHYPDLLPQFYLHAQTKPPGPILFYAVLINLFGTGYATALIAGLLLLALSAGSIVATERMVRAVAAHPDAGMYAAAGLALCPASIVFYPGFDSVYPAIACAMIGTWVLAVRTGRPRYAVAFGASLALALFFTYVLLLLGAFLAAYSFLALHLVPGWTIRKLLTQTATAIATLAGIYLLFWLLTGYNPIASYLESHRLLDEALKWVRRPYPETIRWDIHDFFLGAGWVPGILTLMYLARGPRAVGPERFAIACLALLQPVVVAVTGLVPGETARCWQIVLPLLLIPAGDELARWDRAGRLAAYVAMLAVLAAVAGRLSFISVEPLDKLPPNLL